MKIAIVSTYFGENIGGAEVSTNLLVEGLNKTKNQVKVITLNSLLQSIPTYLRAFLLNTNLLDVYISRYIYNQLCGKGFDIVHVQDLMILPATVLAAKKLKLKVIATVRDLRFVCNLPICQNQGKLYHNCLNTRYLNCLKREANYQFGYPSLAYLIYPFIKGRAKVLRNALNSTDKIIALTNFVKEILYNSRIRTKIEVVHNPMPDWKPKPKLKNKGFIILAGPGRLEPYKGFQLLIKIMPKILQKKKNAKLWIVGTGSYENYLKKLSEKLNIRDSVIFFGKLSQEEVMKKYAECDIVAFPSIWLEAQGRVQLEAMAMKKPLIANNKGGIIETAGKENVCNFFDENELTKEIFKRRKPLKVRKELNIGAYVESILRIYNEKEI